jgi:hypothetical protein
MQHVHQHAAAGRRGVVPPAGLPLRAAWEVGNAEEIHDRHLGRADVPGGDALERRPHLRPEEIVVHDAKLETVTACCLDELGRIGRDRGERLLRQDVAPALERVQDDLPTQVLRRADVDDVEAHASEQLVRVVEESRAVEAELCRREFAPCGHWIGDGDDAAALGESEVSRDVVVDGDATAADQADTERASSGQQEALRF